MARIKVHSHQRYERLRAAAHVELTGVCVSGGAFRSVRNIKVAELSSGWSGIVQRHCDG